MYFMFRIVQEDDTHNVVPKIRQLKNSIGFAPPHRRPTNNFEKLQANNDVQRIKNKKFTHIHTCIKNSNINMKSNG